MRYEKLLLEDPDGGDPITFVFHPALTIITDLGDQGREVLLEQLIASLTGGLKGAHSEIRTDQGQKLTIVRSPKIPDMVVDTARTDEITERFTRADGAVDVLSAWGLDATMARLEMEAVRNGVLTHRGADDRDLDRLARLDQDLLWELVNEVARSRDEAETAQTDFQEMLSRQEADNADTHRSEREEALDAIQSEVYESEQGQGRRRQRLAVAALVGFVGALGYSYAAPSTVAKAAVAAATIPMLWGLYTIGRRLQARWAVRTAEAESGMSLFEAQVARVDSILSSGARRRAVRDSQGALEHAEAAWVEFTEDADLSWVIRHKRLIQKAAAMHRAGELDPQVATESFGALITRLVFEEAEPAQTTEYLPLFFSEPFAAMSAAEVEVAIQLLATSAQTKQRIVMTDQDAARTVARRAEPQQYLGLIDGSPITVPV